jgi:hypothetical protein
VKACAQKSGITVADEERVLWTHEDVECVLISCCAGAELQLRRKTGADFEITLRELYPTKSDLYERARALAVEQGVGWSYSGNRR